MLLAVIFMVALVVLSLALAAPKVAAAIQRDREVELVHRGEQYKRAIRLYYKKFGSYPNSIDQLEKTNNIRFLRKRYLDPLTGKDDWKPVLVGQNHLCPLGFFGQPLGMGNTALAGATPIAGSMDSSAFGSTSSTGASTGANTGASSGSFGSSSSSFGSSTGTGLGAGAGAAGSSTGSSLGGCVTAGSAGSSLNGSGTDSSSGNNAGGTNTSGGSGGGSVGTSSGASSSGFGAGTSTSTTLGGSNSTGGGLGTATSTTLGGAPMMGVMPPQTKATILQYKLKTHYNEWEFDYFPVEETMAAGGSLGGGSNINGSGNSVNGPGSGTGIGTGPSGTGTGTSSTFGGMGGTGSTGSPSQGSTTPQ